MFESLNIHEKKTEGKMRKFRLNIRMLADVRCAAKRKGTSLMEGALQGEGGFTGASLPPSDHTDHALENSHLNPLLETPPTHAQMQQTQRKHTGT